MTDEYGTLEPLTDEQEEAWEVATQAEIDADRDALARHELSLAASGHGPANSEQCPF